MWLIACASTVAFSAQESVYERVGAPGYMSETRFTLTSTVEELQLRGGPDLRAPVRSIPYERGWAIPYRATLVRTLAEVDLVTVGAGTLDAVCDDTGREQLAVEAGESWTYLQRRGEGRIMARIQGRSCMVRAYFREEIFGELASEPPIQWWVEVLYADGTSPGWLLVDEESVAFRFR